MVKPWYGQNSLWSKITRSNGSGQTAPGRNSFRSRSAQTLSGQNTVKHQILSGQIRPNIIWSKYGQTLSGQNTVKHYLVKCGQTLSGQVRINFIRSKAETAPGQPQNVPPPPFRAVKHKIVKTEPGQNRIWSKQHLVKTLGPARNGLPPPPPPKARERASSPLETGGKKGARNKALSLPTPRGQTYNWSNMILTRYTIRSNMIYNTYNWSNMTYNTIWSKAGKKALSLPTPRARRVPPRPHRNKRLIAAQQAVYCVGRRREPAASPPKKDKR